MNKLILSMMTMMATWAFVGITSASADATRDLPEKKISLMTNKAGARDFLVYLLDNSGLKYKIPDSITNKNKITVQAKQAKWSDVFKMAMNMTNLAYEFNNNGVLVVSRRIEL